MPHKHKRKPTAGGDYDLPPSARAAPLSVGKPNNAASQPSRKRKRDANKDDTPRAFTRLLQAQQGIKLPSGLDNGDRQPSKKKRRQKSKSTATETQQVPAVSHSEDLNIRPGERMSDFSARVNQALPISGLARRTQKIDGMKEKQTRTEKKIQRKIAAWRVEDARRRDAAEEEADERDLDEAADLNISEGDALAREAKGQKGRGRDEDPWAVLKKARGGRVSVSDVAQAPPDLVKVKPKFKVRDGARVDVDSVPAAAGSLRKREQLGSERTGVIEAYRRLMAEKRGG